MSEQQSVMDISSDPKEEEESYQWTAITLLQSIAVFLLAGVAEIFGGWMVWVAVRGITDNEGNTTKKPWWYALIGSLILIMYGFIPCLQPTDSFGRIYAVYGGYFIVLSFLFAWALEGSSAKPDLGDCVGGAISIAGVFVIMLWPR